MKADFINKLIADAEQIGINLTDDQAEKLHTYFEMLVEKNKVMNLTAITEENEVITKHFIDSMSIVKSKASVEKMQEKNASLIDVGTGAGFPGMVLKIVFPQLQVVLADSLNKRLLFLNEVIDELGLTGIHTVHGRAEDLARNKEYREKFTISTARAVANMSTLTEYCLPFVKIGGIFTAFKSESSEEELSNAGKAIKILGGSIIENNHFMLPDSDIGRNIIVVEKQAKTPAKYPRKAGLPAKEPIC